MSKYKVISPGKAGLRYMVGEQPEDPNKKIKWTFVKKDEVPENIVLKLEIGQVLSDQDVIQMAPAKECLFCGMFGKMERLVNLQTVYLCEEHYYSESLGKVAQKLKEYQDERSEQTEEKSEEDEKSQEGSSSEGKVLENATA